MTYTVRRPRPIAGSLGMLFGAAALMLVLVQFWAGPFAPQQQASVSIGEFAAEISKSAARELLGKPQPAPEARPWDIDRILHSVAAGLAGMAVVIGMLSYLLRESIAPAGFAILLGSAAIVFQLFTWMILVVMGTLIIVAIIYNFQEIIESAFGG